MAKRTKNNGNGQVVDAHDETTAVLDTPAPADPQPNGDPEAPAQPARTKKRRRDPDAPKNLYLIVAVDRATQRLRVVNTQPTIGRARKALDACGYSLRETDQGLIVLRCKPVA